MEREVIIIGGGIVGLSCAHQLLTRGISVTVIDRDPEGDKASIGNAGGIAVTEVVPASIPGLIWRVPGWLLDPLGPLSIRSRYVVRITPWLLRFLRAGRVDRMNAIATALAALNVRAHEDWMPVLAEIGLASELHRAGALALYETAAAFQRDRAEWELRRNFGIVCELKTGAEAREMEPALGSIVEHAMWLPQWSHVSDPQQIVAGLLASVRSKSANVVKGLAAHVENVDGSHCVVRMSDGRSFTGSSLVVAAGAWSAKICAQLGERVPLESERGYTTTIPDPRLTLNHMMIFAERKFVAAPLACGLRIGGAAEFGGLDAPPNYARSKALVGSAKRYLPDLNGIGGTEWMGHRPATPDSLPVIGRSQHFPNVFYAFGHGHLGLTQAATTGRLIAQLIAGEPSSVDLEPYGAQRFQ